MYKLLKSIFPVLKNAILSGQLFKGKAELIPPIDDIHADWDVNVPVSDDANILVNIFKSKKALAEKRALPVIMCAHPYDNHLVSALGKTPFKGVPKQYRTIPQVGIPKFSTLTSWESPDPNFWVANDYIVVNMNMPGYGGSTGTPSVLNRNQSKVFYEVIEWVAEQDWCNGNVGLNGVSFLAISQYHVAACQDYENKTPKALKCISPWEGITDIYRDLVNSGGIPQEGFANFWWALEIKHSLTGSSKDFINSQGGKPTDFLVQHPFYDEFWEEKRAPCENIDIPILTCVSFSDVNLHTNGSYRSFTDVKSKEKWMYTHRNGKWDAYYSQEVLELTLRFMDYYLKDKKDNGWSETSPIRLEVRSSRDKIHEIRGENEWPISRTQYLKYYLTANNKLLSSPEHSEGKLSYDGKKGVQNFRVTFTEDTEITGHAKLKVWMELQSKNANDFNVFTVLNKYDKTGKRVPFYGTVGNKEDVITRAFMRASFRELDKEKSTDIIPYHLFKGHKKINSGEIICMEIPFPPTSVYFYEGETLELTLASYEIYPHLPMYKDNSLNTGGEHVIHTGGKFDSFLQLPIIPNIKN
ncbi:CocE/NonD family hydrolase [Bernardetia sp. OM2101]|uniref:CocE/NonD family hydrolase n=1 Tax=Bernardetia sp. OM2101 TaxID=3344876 RepID=UPI0035CE950A